MVSDYTLDPTRQEDTGAQSPLSEAEAVPPTQRATTDGPWAWFNKGAMNRIREVMGENNIPSVSSVLVTYLALAEIASDYQSERFAACRGLIMSKAGIKERTLDAAIAVLEKILLVHVERRRIDRTTNLPSIYTLLPPPGAIIAPPPGATIAPVGQATEIPSLAPCIKNSKNKEESKERGRPARNDWLAYADQLKWPREDANAAFDYYEANGWHQSGGNPIKDWRAAARTCYRQARVEEPARIEAPIRWISGAE